MCQGDDPSCAEFERHRAAMMGDLAHERRAFLKSSFVATGAAATLAGGGLSLVSPALAQTAAQRQPGQPSHYNLPANADTVVPMRHLTTGLLQNRTQDLAQKWPSGVRRKIRGETSQAIRGCERNQIAPRHHQSAAGRPRSSCLGRLA